jgi:hypothetical protein
MAMVLNGTAGFYLTQMGVLTRVRAPGANCLFLEGPRGCSLFSWLFESRAVISPQRMVHHGEPDTDDMQ